MNQQFESVWDALEDDPIKAENLKLRSEIMVAINQHLDSEELTQKQIAEIIKSTQPRVSELRKGKIESFRLDILVDIAHRLGLNVSIQIAA